MIKVKNLNLTRNGKYILKDINFELKKNQHLAIIGANGAGKSFLSRVLAADLVANYGSQVQILNSTIGKVMLSQLRKKIGFVATDQVKHFKQKVSYLKNFLKSKDKDFETLKGLGGVSETENSILEVVLTGFFGCFGLSEKPTIEMIQKAKKELTKFNFHMVTDSDSPLGGQGEGNKTLNTQSNFENLSDGEKRKVLLARSLVLDPQILVLDEPCQGLDIPTREAFLQKIEKISEGKLLIYTTHHLPEIPKCIQKVLLLKNGEIFKFGDKKEVLNSKNLSDLFEIPLQIVENDGRFFEVV